jgi:uncharacterized protein (DUF58 family)
MHRSPFHGFSVEFSQHRDYAPGDDLRYVDWKVFGRSDKLYLKQFEEETNLIAYLAVDTSESMTYRSPEAPLSKLDYAKCLAAALAWLVLRQRDSVSLALFAERVERLTRPSGSYAGWDELIHALDQARGAGRTRAGAVLGELAERFRRRGLVILLGDLLEDPAELLLGLRHCRHAGHDVIVFQMLDPAEIDFPFTRPTKFLGLESLPDVQTDPAAIRSAYLRELSRHRQALEAGLRDQHADYVLVRTDQPFDRALSLFLATRVQKQ